MSEVRGQVLKLSITYATLTVFRNVSLAAMTDSQKPGEEPPQAPPAPSRWFDWDIQKSEWDILILSTAFKVLLFPT